MSTSSTEAPGPESPFELRSLDMGFYRWGSLVPVFLPLSPARAQDFPRSLAGLYEGIGLWETDAQFRGWICLTHELTHYLQDLTTGVGHWDHVMRARALPGLYAAARALCGPWVTFPFHLPSGPNPSFSAVDSEFLAPTRRANDAARGDLLFIPSELAPPERQNAIHARLAPLLSSDGDPGVYRIESLLEGEAEAVVLMQVLGVEGATARAWEIMIENSGAWHPDEMPHQYGELLSDMIAAVQHVYGGEVADLQARESEALLKIAARTMCLLVDLACAHPSPEWLLAHDADPYDYQPPVRYARMLSTFGHLDGPGYEAFVPAVVGGDFEAAERVLREHCSYGYATAREVYEDWAERLSERDDPRSRVVDALRADCCRARLEHPSAWMLKSLRTIADQRLPIYVIGPDGLTSVGQRWEHLGLDEAAELYADLMWNGVNLALTDFFYETGRYRCPLARGKVCGAATDGCRAGLLRTSAFPPAEGCQVREWLQRMGFYLGGER